MNTIYINKRYLNLSVLNIEDGFEEMIEKFNRNFREIQENGGGPAGPIGPQGESIPGPPGPVGPKGEDGDSEWSRLVASNLCATDLNLPIEDMIQTINLVTNKYSNKSILLTNLYDDSEGILDNTSFLEELESSSVINTVAADYKLKIYNSDSDGRGKHIHLMNSKLAKNNNNFLCESGFSISDDAFDNTTEILRVKGFRNSLIENHQVIVELIDDYTIFRFKEGSEYFKIDIENKDTSAFGNTFYITKQTKPNINRIPDRTGWNACWEDTTDDAETWEVMYRDVVLNETNEITIDSITYNMGGNTNNITKQENIDLDLPVYLTDNSYIRFKRLNNWVLIDYRIELVKSITDNITVKNIVFKVNKSTVSCRTISWLPGTFIINDSLNNEVDNYFHHFKVESSLFNNAPTFKLLNKFSFSPLVMDADKKKYFIAAQVWATIDKYDPVCERLMIVQV